MRRAGGHWALAVAMAVLTVLVVDLVAIWARSGEQPATGPTALDPEIEARVGELVAFVEEQRQKRFLRPPAVEVLRRREFLAALHDLPDDGEAMEPEVRVDYDAVLVLQALGLVRADFDVAGAAEGAAEVVQGFYDPTEATLYVRADELDAFAESVLVHELTHALDDQHFDLRGRGRPGVADDARIAFLALVEGSAAWVEAGFLATLTPAQRSTVATRDLAVTAPDLPSYFARRARFPYEAGPAFVEHLLATRGPGSLDEAFARPPETTEQILHPELYLRGHDPVGVVEPRALGTVVERGSLGELGLGLVLAEATSPTQALTAAAGWGGDRFVAWTSGRDVCLRWTIAMDTDADLAELAVAFQAVVDANPGASFAVADDLRFTNCVR